MWNWKLFFCFCNEIFLSNVKINACHLAKIINLLGQPKITSKAGASGLLMAVSSEGSTGSGQTDMHELLTWLPAHGPCLGASSQHVLSLVVLAMATAQKSRVH